jgi:hypothetical protein
MKNADSTKSEPGRIQSAFVIWAPFVLTTLLAFVVGETASSTSWYYQVLLLLGALNLALGILIVWRTNGRLSAAALVFIGLIIGQFQLVEMAVVLLGWSIVGFAP